MHFTGLTSSSGVKYQWNVVKGKCKFTLSLYLHLDFFMYNIEINDTNQQNFLLK